MKRVVLPLVALASAGLLVHCSEDADLPKCSEVTTGLGVQVSAGAVNDDGSVTVYGTTSLSFEGGEEKQPAELAVRAVYVAGVEVQPGTDGFNFRTWSAVVPRDRIVAHADGGTRARLPVTLQLYGGCSYELPSERRPEVAVRSPSDAGLDAADAADAAEAGDADPSDAALDGD